MNSDQKLIAQVRDNFHTYTKPDIKSDPKNGITPQTREQAYKVIIKNGQ
jgi:hypothetical protein